MSALPPDQPLDLDRWARHPGFVPTIVTASIVGALSGLAIIAFFVVEDQMHHLLSGATERNEVGFGSGSLAAAAVLVVAGVAVGLLRRTLHLDGPDPNFVDEMVEGRVSLVHSLKLAIVSLVGIAAGASIGPEAPLAGIGAGIGTTAGDRLTRHGPRMGRTVAAEVDDMAFAGTAGIFGGFATFPFAGPIIALEISPRRPMGHYARLIPGLVAATVALAVAYPVIDTPFLRIYPLEQPDLEAWWIAVAAGLGLVGAVAGIAVALTIGACAKLGATVANPMLRASIGGVILGGLAFALPLTTFSGQAELGLVFSGEVTTTILLATLVGKAVALGVSLRWGFFGGAIFPLLFIGAALGHLASDAWTGVPAVVPIAALAGAVTVALVPLPLMVLVLTIFMFGLSVELSVVPSVAIVVSYIAVHGTGIIPRPATAADPGGPDPTGDGTGSGDAGRQPTS